MKISRVGLLLRVLIFGTTVFVFGACAVRRPLPVDDWNRFPPYETNFRSFFDSTAELLDPVEGVWLRPGSGRFAIVRDLRYVGFGFVAVWLGRQGGEKRFGDFPTRRLWFALATVTDSVYSLRLICSRRPCAPDRRASEIVLGERALFHSAGPLGWWFPFWKLYPPRDRSE